MATKKNASKSIETKKENVSMKEEKKVPELPMCGDGGGLRANKGRNFLPGHDAKLASMLQKVADGRMAQEDLPSLVKVRIADGSLQKLSAKFSTMALPGAKEETHLISVSVRVRVPAGAGVEAAREAVTGRLELRTMKVEALATFAEEVIARTEEELANEAALNAS